ncbi:oligosaccharide flippase family protein [Deinococcus sp. RM]|uniref:oligosaccharide flippase family protein n=1 Tax=Deinococcus sp. RM TaxID=2316359 RepID=UPI001314281A|nr:oligosaccharide flippase family protein [Deinococcus sp. RM]
MKLNILKNNTAANYLYSVSNTIIPLLMIPIFSRLLDAASFGSFIIFQTISSFMMVFVDFGLTFSAAHLLSKYDKSVYTLGSSIRIMAAFIASLIIIFVNMNFEILPNEVYIYVSLVFVAIGYATLPYWIYNASEESGKIAYLYFFSRCVTLLITVIYVLWKPGLESAILGFSISNLVSSLIVAIHAIRKFGIFLKNLSLKSITDVGKGLFMPAIAGVMGALFSSSLVILIGLNYGPDLAGKIAIADRISKFVMAAFAPLSNALLPKSFSAFSISYESGLSFISKNTAKLLVIYICTWSVILTFRIPISRFFGIESTEGYVYLTLLSLWGAFSLTNNLFGVQYLSGQGRFSEYSLIFNLFAGILLILFASYNLLNFNVYYFGVCMLVVEAALSVVFISKIRIDLLKRRKE